MNTRQKRSVPSALNLTIMYINPRGYHSYILVCFVKLNHTVKATNNSLLGVYLLSLKKKSLEIHNGATISIQRAEVKWRGCSWIPGLIQTHHCQCQASSQVPPPSSPHHIPKPVRHFFFCFFLMVYCNCFPPYYAIKGIYHLQIYLIPLNFWQIVEFTTIKHTKYA